MKRLNFISLHDRIRHRDQAIKFAQDHGLIKSAATCDKCHCKFPVQNTRAESNYVFFECYHCKKKESIRKDTFLYNKVILFCKFDQQMILLLLCLLQNIAIKSFLLLALLFCQMDTLTLPQIIYQVSINLYYSILHIMINCSSIWPTLMRMMESAI